MGESERRCAEGSRRGGGEPDGGEQGSGVPSVPGRLEGTVGQRTVRYPVVARPQSGCRPVPASRTKSRSFRHPVARG
eukprot:gene17285-biopygen4682